MKIVIDIDKEDWKDINNIHFIREDLKFKIGKAIMNGTQLPKGHGRLFDERDIVNGNYEVIGNRIYELEPIIEADKSESEEE